jgi:hypothetical protein
MTTNARADAIARELADRGLIAPALVLLEAHRPFRPLLALGAQFLSPLTRPLFGGAADAVEGALRSEAAYESLLNRLRREART